MAKIDQFSPKSKAIHLVFCEIFTKNHFSRFSVENEKWLKSTNFRQKVRLHTWYFTKFSPKITVAKIDQFSPKSKAIHLVFCEIFTKNHFSRFSVENEKWLKSTNFRQKVRLYTWYFAKFSPKITFLDSQWRMKSG